jgi:hypothetical protein
MSRRGVTIGIAGFLFASVVGFALAAPLPAGGTFADDNGNIHEGSIEAIAAAEITKGCNPPVNDLYCPSDRVNRGQMAAFLTRALGLTVRLDNPFTDDDGSIFEADIERMAAAGITKGCNPPANNLFCPNAYVTRGQMAAFLVRALGYSDAGTGDLFTDDDDSIFEGSIDRLGTAGVTKGCNPPLNDLFCPNSLVLRDQMASFLSRALDLDPIVPPPITSTTQGGDTGTTLPGLGSATLKACGTDTPGDEFSLDQDCVEAVVYNSEWANAIYADVSFRWLDTNGDPVGSCPVRGNCIVVRYHYSSGFLVGWSMYFYVDGEGRSPGWHTLEIWKGTSAPLQELLLRDHFELSVIPPVDASTTTTTTTTTLPPRPDVSWECSVGGGGVRTCSGNIDTLDAAIESWSCTPTESGYPTDPVPWDCSGDIDKRAAGNETWSCDVWGDCLGNVDTSDLAEESWSISQWGSSPNEYLAGSGDLDKSSSGWEGWYCMESDSGLMCNWDDNVVVTAWTCDGTLGVESYGGDWSCSGDVGRLAPMVGPVPVDYID